MYESKETSIRGIIVTILLIILVICVLIWIFPTKKDIKGISGSNNDALLSGLFGYNLRVLENAGRAYYYSATLPKNNGDSVQIALGKLVEKKILLDINDKNGKQCDRDASYVQLTKKSNGEYEMKSYLSCDGEDNYIVKTLDCSSFKSGCKATEISKKDDNKETNKEENNKEENNKENNNETTYYKYLYSCPKTSQSYSSWSDWTTNYISSSSNRVVDTKVEYETKRVKVGTKQEPVTTYKTVETTEYVEETKRYVDYKPNESCVTLPRTGYTLYECTVSTPKTVTKQVPVTEYNTVDDYDYVSTPVTYYRYKTLTTKTSYYETWSTKLKDTALTNKGCTIVKSEKVTK